MFEIQAENIKRMKKKKPGDETAIQQSTTSKKRRAQLSYLGPLNLGLQKELGIQPPSKKQRIQPTLVVPPSEQVEGEGNNSDDNSGSDNDWLLGYNKDKLDDVVLDNIDLNDSEFRDLFDLLFGGDVVKPLLPGKQGWREWLLKRTDTKSFQFRKRMYSVQPSGEKGYGLFAEQDIKVGDILFNGSTRAFDPLKLKLNPQSHPMKCDFGVFTHHVVTVIDDDNESHEDKLNGLRHLHPDYVLETNYYTFPDQRRDGKKYFCSHIVDPYDFPAGFMNEGSKRSMQNVIMNDTPYFKANNNNKVHIRMTCTALKNIKRGEEILWDYGSNYPRQYQVLDDRPFLEFELTDADQRKIVKGKKITQQNNGQTVNGYVSETATVPEDDTIREDMNFITTVYIIPVDNKDVFSKGVATTIEGLAKTLTPTGDNSWMRVMEDTDVIGETDNTDNTDDDETEEDDDDDDDDDDDNDDDNDDQDDQDDQDDDDSDDDSDDDQCLEEGCHNKKSLQSQLCRECLQILKETS